jgi:hypothetical protein
VPRTPHVLSTAGGWIEPPVIADHKTTKSLEYVKSEDTLRNDPQVISYGRWGVGKYYPLEWSNLGEYADAEVNVRFIYYLTQQPKGKLWVGDKQYGSAVTNFYMRVGDLVAPWERLEDDVRAMLDLARRADEIRDIEVEPNWSSCGAWGGCPHRERCSTINREAMDAQKLVGIKTGKDGKRVPLSDLFDAEGVQDAAPEVVKEDPSATIARIRDEVESAQHEGFTLYVDTVPAKGAVPASVLEEYLAPHLATIVRDWNQTNPGARVADALQIEFGKWKGPLRACIAAHPPRTDIMARAFGDLSNTAIEALRPLARVVWQGVR